MLEFPGLSTFDMPSSQPSQSLSPPTLCILSAVALMMGGGEAQAWGFGRAQSSAVMGMPLDFSVALRLDSSESPPECLAADVSAGDIPVPRSAVFVSMDSVSGSPVVRVRTTVAIDEPLVTIKLSAGCGSSIARRFTLFVDPPGHVVAPVLAQAEAIQAAVPAPAVVASPAPAPSAQLLPPPAPAATPGQVDPPRPTGAAAPAASMASATQAAAASSPGTGSAIARARLSDGAAALADASARATKGGEASAPRAKLRLDAPTLMTSAAGAPQGGAVAAALQSAQDAASAARASASAAQARAAEMQKSIDALRQEAQANREAVARLTRALEEAQGGAPSWLWAALAALGALSALLFARMRRLQLGASASPWWSANAAPAAESPGHSPEKTSSGLAAAALAPSGSVESVTSPTVPPLPALPFVAKQQPGAAASSQASGTAATTSELPEVATETDWDALPGVSVEELLDLQQQAEFFSVLGQDDAALKLLAEHLAQTRGDYPLPYLQLMDICRRRSDKAGYERTRSRLQRRFGTSWPGWHEQSQDQRRLEDCPDLLVEIERVWKDPAEAMGSLEGLLRAGNRVDCLEPTVQSELLFLYTLARDLQDRPVRAPEPVPVTAPVAAASGAVDIDFDLGLDQAPASSAALDLALDFDPPTAVKPAGPAVTPKGLEAAAAGATALGVSEFSMTALPAEPPRSLPAIDLPLSGPEDGSAPTSTLAAAAFAPGRASENAAVELKLDETWNPSPAGAAQGPKPGAEALSLQFPDLEIPGAEELARAQAAAVDLELTLDTPDLAALPPPLSADEERAASRFSVFSEEFDQVNKR